MTPLLGSFQSTLPRGERLYSVCEKYGLAIFQSTLPRGERPTSAPYAPHPLQFQSTLPRGERHNKPTITFNVTDISIHAPARGATMGLQTQVASGVISIHAPARGATYKMACSVSLNVFQSTLPRGERQ